MLWLPVVIGIWLIIAASSLTAYVASEKGRSGADWFFLSLLTLGLALYAVIGLPVREHLREHQEDTETAPQRRHKGAGQAPRQQGAVDDPEELRTRRLAQELAARQQDRPPRGGTLRRD